MTGLNADAASIYSAGRWVRGKLSVEGERVTGIEGEIEPHPSKAGPYLVPAFVDLHVHGGGGHEMMRGGRSSSDMARFHASHGTGALCPTTLTAPADQIGAAIAAAGDRMGRQGPDEAEILGVHIEGPFINPLKLGGQPPYAIDADIALASLWLSLAPVKVVTMAPEIAGARELIRFLVERGVRVQIGHSLADSATVAEAQTWGASGFAHLYNAVGPMSARSPGVIGWALGHARWAELICDLKHVHGDLLRHAIHSIENAYFITDCCAAGGLPDGEYDLGLNPVTKADGVVKLRGTEQLAASVLTADVAFRNIASLGVGLETAVWMTSTRPAQFIGASGYGDLTPGKMASAVLLDHDLQVLRVWLKGQEIFSR